MDFEVKKKTGFSVIEGPVTILDNDASPFYSTLNLDVDKFNLPPGIYSVAEGKIKRRQYPVFFFLPFLPLSERFFYPNPKYFQIVWSDNPNKCSVLWDEKTILFDKSLRSLPKFVRCYIYFHELGHYYYDTEKYCDLFASNCMLRTGFNPSQVLLAQNFGLSDSASSFERKQFINTAMFNTNSKPA